MTEEEVKPAKRQHQSIDKGYAWAVLVAAVMLNVLVEGAFSGMSVLVVELKYHFDADESSFIWIGGILMSIGFFFSFVVGWLVKRFGCRRVGIASSLTVAVSFLCASFAQTIPQLMLTYGVMLGLSITCYFNISSIAVQQYFEKHRAFAQGTLMAALSIGTFLWPPLMRLLINTFGWRGALMFIAGLELHGVALSMLIRPLPAWALLKPKEEEQKKEEVKTVGGEMEVGDNEVFLEDGQVATMEQEQVAGKKRSKFGSCFNSMFKVLRLFPHYTLYVLGVIMTQSGNVLPYTLVPALADSYGIDGYRQAALVSIGAASSGVGRVIAGLIGDHPRVNRILMCALSGMVAGILTCFTALMSTFTQLAIIFAVIGMPSASLMSGYGSAAVDIVGKKYVQQGIGLMSVAFGIAHFSCFLVNGILTDYEGGMTLGFFIFGVVEAIGGIIFLICFLIDRRRKRREQAEADTGTTDKLNAVTT